MDGIYEDDSRIGPTKALTVFRLIVSANFSHNLLLVVVIRLFIDAIIIIICVCHGWNSRRTKTTLAIFTLAKYTIEDLSYIASNLNIMYE